MFHIRLNKLESTTQSPFIEFYFRLSKSLKIKLRLNLSTRGMVFLKSICLTFMGMDKIYLFDHSSPNLTLSCDILQGLKNFFKDRHSYAFPLGFEYYMLKASITLTHEFMVSKRL